MNRLLTRAFALGRGRPRLIVICTAVVLCLPLLLLPGCGKSTPAIDDPQFILESDLGPVVDVPAGNWDDLEHMDLDTVTRLLGPATESPVTVHDGTRVGTRYKWDRYDLEIDEGDLGRYAIALRARWNRPVRGVRVGDRLSKIKGVLDSKLWFEGKLLDRVHIRDSVRDRAAWTVSFEDGESLARVSRKRGHPPRGVWMHPADPVVTSMLFANDKLPFRVVPRFPGR